MNRYALHLGDCIEVLKEMPDNSVDSIVTDPPYGLKFMSKKWDYDVPDQAIWEECLRVLKPGGHLLAFAGTRTQHRMAVRIEDAGFEIRDMIAWVYGSGFPKGMNLSKALDKIAGAEREIVGEDPQAARRNKNTSKFSGCYGDIDDKPSCPLTAPATEAAKQWEGWNTTLKPSLEPITVARKPFKGSLAANVLANGTGAINIDGCRVWSPDAARSGNTDKSDCEQTAFGTGWQKSGTTPELGRWPANLIHDGSDEVVAIFPENAGAIVPVKGTEPSAAGSGNILGLRERVGTHFHGDKGSAARFFYCAKTSSTDRHEGLDNPGAQFKHNGTLRQYENGAAAKKGNHHPTVKPTDLMAYLCRLVTPPGGTVLDPFMGSGSTGKAAMREGFHFIGIELDADYMAIAEVRVAHEAGKASR